MTQPFLCSCGQPITGRVSWPPDLKQGPGEALASRESCADPDHHARIADWVEARTGHRGVYVPVPAEVRS